MTDLTFVALRAANTLRLPTFKNAKGEPAHSAEDGSDWANEDWLEAVVGELGEYANVSKKYRRGDIDHATFHSLAADELADTVTYLDILAFRHGVDFNDVLPVKDFDNLAILCCEHLPGTRAAALLDVLGWLGIYSEVRDAAPYRNPVDTQQRTATTLAYLLTDLAGLAKLLNIDLGAAIKDKFNRVSDRVGSAVWLDYKNRPVMREPCNVDPERCQGNGFGPCPLCYE